MNSKYKKFLIITSLFLTASCNKPIPKAEIPFTIDNIEIDEGDSIEIPVKSTDIYWDILYIYEGNYIDIQNGVLTALSGNSFTRVTASYDDYKTTFDVIVNGNSIGKNIYDSSGFTTGFYKKDNTFIKSNDLYSETYLYYKGDAIAGSSYAVSGTISIDKCYEDAYAKLILHESKDKYYSYIMRFNNENSFTIFSDYYNKQHTYELVKTIDSNNFNFLLLFNNNTVYLYIDNAFVHSYDTELVNAHFGFGGEKSFITLNNLNANFDKDKITELIKKLDYPFGDHFKLDADNYNGIFIQTDEYVYEKRSFHYLQTFFYIKGKAVAGSNYSLNLDITMNTSINNHGQVALLITLNQANMLRFVFEGNNANRYHLFKDEKINGTFTNYVDLGTTEKTIQLTVNVYDGQVDLYNKTKKLMTTKYNPGETHLGIGGDNSQFTISNIDGFVNY